MPKSKKETSNDSGSSDNEIPKTTEKKRKGKEPKEKPAAKKAKQETTKTFPFELGANRFVEVKEFKGKVYVDVREKYANKETAEMLPGKRGLMLTIEQWKKLIDLADDVNQALTNF